MDYEIVETNVIRRTVGNEQVLERRSVRWMMVAYDFVIYMLCWLGVFVLQPSLEQPLSQNVPCIYLGIGLVFFLSRFCLKCYNQIFRYGTVHAFTRELFANVLAAILYVIVGLLLSKVWPVAQVPLTYLFVFSAVYVLISFVARMFYSHVYNFALKDTAASRLLRRLLELLAHVDFVSGRPGAVLHLVLEPERNAASPINELQNIAEKFAIRGEITAITQINKGYINRTYKVETVSDTGNVHKYTLQRINTNVFPDVD